MSAGPVLAHAGLWSGPGGPEVAAGLLFAAFGYVAARLVRRRRRAVLPAGPARAGAFLAGLAALGVALSPPLEALAAERFAAHMIQHLLLLLVAPPLVVAGRPGAVAFLGLPPPLRRRVGWPAGTAGGRTLRRLADHPGGVWAAGGGGRWAWHLPALYDAALRHPGLHALEHVTFLVTAVAFWRLVIGAGDRRRPSRPAALALTFATGLASGALGAALTFAGAPLYPLQAARAAAAGVAPLADQQLAGALMWTPAGLVYLAAMVTLLVRWFADLAAASPEREAAPARSTPEPAR